MNNKQRIRFIYLQLLPVALLVGLIALIVIPQEEEECYGLAEGLGQGFGILLLVILSAITLFAQLVAFFYHKMIIHRLAMLAICAMLALLGRWLLLLPPAYFRAEVILEADNNQLLDGANLKLREDGTYSATEKQSDWTCIYHGDYVRRGDTIFLDYRLMDQTRGLFSSGYIQEPYGMLVPLDLISPWGPSPDLLEIKNQIPD